MLPSKTATAQTTSDYESMNEAVKLTPRPNSTSVGGTESLSGKWDFTLSTSDTPPTDGGETVTPDKTSYGNDGTLVNSPSVVTDPNEQAIDLVDNQYVTVGDASSLDFTEPGFTIQMRFKHNGDGPLFSKGNDQYAAGIWGGTVEFWTAGDGDWSFSLSGGGLTIGEWYTVTWVIGTSESTLYVDGQAVDTASTGISSLPHVDAAPEIGINTATGNQGSPVVDEFRAFDTTLTQTEVQNGFDLIPSSAVAWLPFNTVTSGTSPDESSVGNDATLYNSPSLVPGQYGQGIDLVDTASVSVEGDSELDLTSTGFTLQATVKYDGGDGLILDKGNSTSGTEQFGLGVYGGDLSFWLHDAAENWPSLDGSSALPIGEWHTVTVVVDGNEIRMYLDDTQIGSTSHSVSNLVSSTAALAVGGNALDISVKSTKIFDKALSDSEVSNGFSSIPSSALLWLTYNEIIDTTVKWQDESVPGQWAYNGYFDPEGEELAWYHADGEYGWYRRDFDVPTDMQDGRIKLRFDAVYSEAWIYLNGQEVIHHVGGYSPFEADVTDVVNTSDTNTLYVQVSQRSTANDVGWQNVTGGITRDVELVSLPEAYVGECYVTTDVQNGGDSATITVDMAVDNERSANLDSATLAVTVTDEDGQTVGTAGQELSSIAAGSSQSATLTVDITDPTLWNPEQPHLYTVDVELTAGGETEIVTERIGVREVQVEDNKLLLNNEPVKLRGMNWEEIHLSEHGHAVPEAITKKDARRLKEANINYIRTAHHPVSEAFLDACDELGIVVEEEAPMMFLGSNRLAGEDEDNNPNQLSDPYPDVIVRQVLEMIERDRNRTSVCIWSVANESHWFDVFGTIAQLVKEVDSTRPTIFNHDAYSAGDSWHDLYDIRSMHYPAFRAGSSISDTADLTDPVFYGEYAHTYCYNDAEIVTDPGLRDQWGILFEKIWEDVCNADSVAGAALWAGGDHLEQWGEYYWGLLDRNRRPRPEYWHVKKIYAPVKVTDTSWSADGSKATVTIENRHEFVNLSERTVEWQTGGVTQELSLNVPAGETTTRMLDVQEDEGTLIISHPEQEYTINQITVSPDPDAPVMPADVDAQTSSGNGTIEVTTSSFTLVVDENDGTIEFSPSDGSPIVVDGPELAVTPIQSEAGRDYDRTIDHRLSGRSVTNISVDGDTIVIDVTYDGAEGSFRITPVSFGLDIEYDFTLNAGINAREVGLVLPAASDMTTLSWQRNGLWDTYPSDHIGRKNGTATAFPSGSQPSNVGIDMQTGQPWKDDETTHGSNDFRSTKRNVYMASLTDGSGRGLQARSDGSQHVRAQVKSNVVDLLVLDRSISGTNANDWLDRHPVMNEDVTLESGANLQGSATFTLAGTIIAPIGDSSSPPSDIDGDGLYEDVDGDGQFTLDDVTHLFEYRNTPAVQNNPSNFNFDGRQNPTEVTLADVQALYERLQGTEQ